VTTDELAAIRARCDAATPGPWRFGVGDRKYIGQSELLVVACDEARELDIALVDVEGGGYHHQDAEFIAHARTDVPALVARVEELEAALAKVDGLWDAYGHSHNSPYERDVNTIARRALGGES